MQWATTDAVCELNEGVATKLSILKCMKIEPGVYASEFVLRRNNERIKFANQLAAKAEH